ncbi:hypothetical protein D3C87_2004730 [compost metagenome]
MAAQVKQMAGQAVQLAGVADALKTIVVHFKAQTGAPPADTERRVPTAQAPLLLAAQRR